MGDDPGKAEREWRSPTNPRRSPMDTGDDRKGCPLLLLALLAFASLPIGVVVGAALWLFGGNG